ncbi:TetR family transcriptional regulator [Paenibacillus sp. NPDC056579]|uniref:TetR family transcriptional regulator n=1 Tax=unclassified Paenibacillus TaxID=185978 RepID=UPI001EF7EC79|nr:TetR family transcriptional regulator [Paenibacillus sp. H1-7]ULL18754.1 TetR/AcrR family transcriptional regulator [Paenibacillus sp. H1-7]
MAHAESDMKIRILLAAKKLFALQGFDGTSVRQICEEAGANVALVSYYFGGKEKVFHALFDYFFVGHRLHEVEEQLREPVKGLGLLIREIVWFCMNDPELASIIQQEFAANSQRAPQIQERTLPFWMKIREMLEKGKQAGRFRYESLDHTLIFVVSTALSMKKATMLQPLLAGREATVEETAEYACLFIMRALGAADGGEG